MAFDATGRLLIIYSAFAKCLRKSGNTTKKFISSIGFKKAYDSVRREVLYKILLESDIPRKLVRLIKMNLTEMYNRVRVGKNVSARFSIRNGLKKTLYRHCFSTSL